MSLQRLFLPLALLCVALASPVAAQTFSVSPNTVAITATPGINHLPLAVKITTSGGYDLSKLTCTSDSTWVSPKVDVAHSSLALSFTTSDMVKRTYTATLTLGDGTQSTAVYVQATVSPLKIVALKADPTRPLVYGAQQDGVNAGAVVIYNPIQQAYVGAITVGNKPCDLAISKDASELLVICSASQSITAIDLNTLTVKETIPLPKYTDWGTADTSAHVAYGPANILYYTDGAWAPVLHVLDRSAHTVLQDVMVDASSGNGWGDFAVTSDQKSLFGWAQYGWSAGWLGCYISKYAIGTDGKLTFQAETSTTYPTTLNRDPLDTPTLISADDKAVVIKQVMVSAADINTVVQGTSTPIYSISPKAEVLATNAALYSGTTGNKLFDLPVTSTVQAITWDYSRFVYFNATAQALAVLDLTKTLSLSSLGLSRAPADQAIVLVPTQLQWSPVLGVSRYRVYLGTSQTAVTAATTASPEYLGEASTTSLALTQTLTAGKTYYWRVDAVTTNDVVAGPVTSFTVSSIASDTSSISAATVQAQANYTVPIGLSAATAGRAWSASSSAAWISFDATSGTTPATLHAILDATQLSTGVNQATISITTPEGTFTIPVTLQVDALKLTVIRSDPQSTKAYAISEATATSGASRAYLLEIDSLLQKVTRVVAVGTSATDVAISHPDNRVYVPNWKPGGLLAVNLGTFQVEKTFATPPFNGVGYSQNDAYRVSAGGAGRLITEGEDQWVALRLFDTTTGVALTSTTVDEGGGQYAGTRYYFHGDDNSTGAQLHKIDTVADKFNEVAHVAISGVSYFGSRTVVVSDDGTRVFWNGAAFDSDLKVLWNIGDEIVATSRDGQYAISKTKIYDVNRLDVVATLPTALGLFAYNTATARIVSQSGSTLAFYSPFGTNVLGRDLAPADGAVLSTVTQLGWTQVPGIDGYRVYLGTSQNAVTQATTTSAEYLGTVTGSSIALTTALATGHIYYWRVDLVTGGQVVASQAQSFTVSAVAPGVTRVDGVAVQGYGTQPAPISLTSATAGLAWTASAADAWVKLGATSGTTPASLTLTLDASKLAPGTSTSSITITGTWGTLTLPVAVQVDPLALTVVRSDPKSAKVYAVSEATATGGGASRAFLLEIDTATEQVTRTVAVGSSVTDIAISNPDNRVYVTNWKTGGVLGINLGTFTLDRTIPTPAFNTSGDNDAYRIAAGVAGRLITEAEDQWININLYDTANGAKLATAFEREGGGQFEPTGRYYYHGDSNISNASLHKLDTLADKFTEVATSVVGSLSSYGSRSVVVTEDGTRVFWGGRMFDPNVQLLWDIRDEIYAATKDGRYAVAGTKIYDTVQRQPVFGLPAAGKVSAVNSQTQKLVLQTAQGISFLKLDPTAPLPAPVLSASDVTITTAKLNWVLVSLQTGFTLQMRQAGDVNWTDLASGVAPATTSYTVPALVPNTAYDFRIRAESLATGSSWSNVVNVTTPNTPPIFSQQPRSQTIQLGGAAVFTAGVKYTGGATYQWYKNGQPLTGATDATLTLSGVTADDGGTYAVVVTNSAGTTTSQTATLTVGNTRIANFSIRATAGPGADILTVGFSVSGGSKKVLLRGDGPTLTNYQVGGVLVDPKIDLFVQGTHWLAGNDNWDSDGGTQIADAANSLSAFPLNAGSGDAAILATLNSGTYSVQVSGVGGTSGVAMAEIYDAETSTPVHLVNVSALTKIGTGDATLIGGFVITGNGTKTVLIRAVGPSLATYQVGDPLPDPILQVVRVGNPTPIGSNDNWGGSAAASAVFTKVGAFPLDPASKDAALVLTLGPGNYSGIVRGVGNATGTALLEVYEVP